MTDTLNGSGKNVRDPLMRSAPERVAHLTREFGRVADRFSIGDVVNASAGMMVTAMRQAHPTREAAEREFNEVFGRMKQLLMDHYDGTRVRKDGLFPFDQNISPSLVVARPKIITH